MLKPHDMYNVVVAGPKNVQEPVIKELHELKVMHIMEHAKSELADIGTPMDSASRLSELLVKVRGIQASLNINGRESEFEPKGLLEIESTLKKLNDEVSSNSGELKKISETISRNESIRKELEIIRNIQIPVESFISYRSLAYFTGFVKDKKAVFSIRSELESITKNFMLLDSTEKNRNFIVLFVVAKIRENAADVLRKHGFSQITFANLGNLRGKPLSSLKKLEEESARLHSKKGEVNRKLERLGRDYKSFLIASENFLSIQLEKAEAPLKFASTPSSFLVKGWIPYESLHKSIDRLNRAGNGRVYVHFEPAKKKDKVPVKLKNPNAVKPFEFFLDLYSMPTYREIDPTFFVFLTFPIFFGIMLGDIGYGITSLLFFWVLKKKMPKAKNFFSILMLASFVSILFGFLFGEFFGFEKIGDIHLWHLISRSEPESLFTLLFAVLIVGAVHVNLGLIVGFVNIFKDHGLMAAIYEKAGWIVLELGVAMLALSYLNMMTVSPLAGAAFMGAAILMIFKGEGVKGIMELPAIFTNILSYARLMAIGLSSVILAVIINESATEFFHQGGFFVLIGILILIVGHVINIMLGLLGSFLHSLRLHYVEFFSKFFHGGAKKYQPFGARDD